MQFVVEQSYYSNVKLKNLNDSLVNQESCKRRMQHAYGNPLAKKKKEKKHAYGGMSKRNG